MTYDLDILTHIADLAPQLSKSETKVAAVIRDDLAFCANASINELAARIGVSEATITRFARAVGCKDVRELKMRLAQSLAIGQRFVSAPVYSDTQGVFAAIRDMLDLHEQRVSEQALGEMVAVLGKASNIAVFGCGGGSGMMALEACNRLFRLGFRCSHTSDGVMGRMVASTLRADDVLLLFSLTGRTPEVLEIAHIARQYGARLAAITQFGSPLADLADCALTIETREGDDIFRPTTARYALMLMMDLLAMKLAQVHEAVTRENLRRIKLNLDTHRGGSDRQPLGD